MKPQTECEARCPYKLEPQPKVSEDFHLDWITEGDILTCNRCNLSIAIFARGVDVDRILKEEIHHRGECKGEQKGEQK